MRVLLLAVGRMKSGPERELLTRYCDRAAPLVRNLGLTGFAAREVEEGRARSPAERKRDEARALQAQLPSGALVLALDERGGPLSSPDLASLLTTARDSARSAVALVIGGPDGLDQSWRQDGARLIAYGSATFPHQLVRVLAAEQIYRALTIMAGHPYHRV